MLSSIWKLIKGYLNMDPVNNTDIFNTKDLWICDTRMVYKREGNLSLSTTQPCYAICIKKEDDTYQDVMSGCVYLCEDIALPKCRVGERYVRSARMFSKEMIRNFPKITLEKIQEILYEINDLNRPEDVLVRF